MTAVNVPLEKILPQRPPFVLIDTLGNYSAASATTDFTVPENHVLVEDGILSEAGVLENMAQTAAAQLGYTAFLNGVVAPLGFIAAVRNFEANAFPRVGQKIQTTMTYISVVLNIQVVNTEVYLDGQKIASAELKIFIQK